MQIWFDISKDKFYELLKKSTLSVIALDTIGPVGMTVLLNTAMRKIPIIATKTPSIQKYIFEESSLAFQKYHMECLKH